MLMNMYIYLIGTLLQSSVRLYLATKCEQFESSFSYLVDKREQIELEMKQYIICIEPH